MLYCMKVVSTVTDPKKGRKVRKINYGANSACEAAGRITATLHKRGETGVRIISCVPVFK